MCSICSYHYILLTSRLGDLPHIHHVAEYDRSRHQSEACSFLPFLSLFSIVGFVVVSSTTTSTKWWASLEIDWQLLLAQMQYHLLPLVSDPIVTFLLVMASLQY